MHVLKYNVQNIWAVEDSIVFDIFYIVILYRYKDTNVGGPDCINSTEKPPNTKHTGFALN